MTDRPRRALLALAVAAVLVQCVVLYAPDAPGVAPFPGADKVVHVTVFLVPALLGVLAGLRAPWVLGLLAGHAVLSELVQWRLLPHRSGDPLDAVADLVGVGLGWLVASWVRRRAARRPS